jgi:hypothetical protein
MPRYLVVADQTLGGDRLMEAIRRRVVAGRGSFYVLLLKTPPTQAPGTSGFAGDVHPAFLPGPPDEAAQRRTLLTSQARLDTAHRPDPCGRGRRSGGLGDPDPVKAIGILVAAGEEFDEIILSTLPSWLGMDIPDRIERTYRLPVTTATPRRSDVRTG